MFHFITYPKFSNFAEFMRFITVVEEDRIRYKDTMRELDELKVQLRNTQTELSTFERKFDMIRQMFDKEKNLRIKAEKDLETKVPKISNLTGIL